MVERAGRFARPLLAGAAQVLFCDSPATGAWFILAALLVSPSAALAGVLGLLVGTGWAVGRGWNRQLREHGLFGYNGAMVGLAWPSLFPFPSPAFFLVVPAALAATWLQGRMLPAFALRELPVLGVPAVLVVWGAALAGSAAGIGAGLGNAPSAFTDALPVTSGDVVAFALGVVPAVVAAGAGLWATSRPLLGLGLLGLLGGLAGAVAIAGPAGTLWVGAYAYTALPTALAVAIFYPLGPRPLVLALGLSFVSAGAWAVASWVLEPLGLLPLTAVSHLLVLALLLAARTNVAVRGLGTAPRRLSEAGPRVTAPAAAFARTSGAEELAILLRRSSRIVVLSGAGVSTESGIPDYRSQVGFWYDANPEELVYRCFVTSEASRRLYWRLHRRFSRVASRALPNPAHAVIADLHRAGRLQGVVTQNVDGLHQRAGVPADRVVELHGSLRDVVCVTCWARIPYDAIESRVNGTAPPCDRCGGVLKIDTVSFGEPLDMGRLTQAARWCMTADLLVVVGTSLQVNPVAELPRLARARGVPIAVVNRTATPIDPWATVVVRGPAAPSLQDSVRRAMSHPPARTIRGMTRVDFQHLCLVMDDWWADSVRYLLHPLYLEHFPQTCLVAEEAGRVVGFLVGFVSQGRPDEAYVHLVGTAPHVRQRGVGRELYDHFFRLVASRGCVLVRAITVPHNEQSIAFHRQLGFRLCDEGAAWLGAIPYFPDHAGPGVDCVVMERKL